MTKLARIATIVLISALPVSCAISRTADFSSWNQLGDAEWQVDGENAATGPSDAIGFLVSPTEFDDFRLSVDFHIDDGINSGIFIRCSDTSKVATITPMSCYEVNIWDNHPNQAFRTGSIVTLVPPQQRVDTLGQWNTYEITASGTSIRVTLNGVETAELEDGKLRSGRVALQYMGGGELQFRNLRVESL